MNRTIRRAAVAAVLACGLPAQDPKAPTPAPADPIEGIVQAMRAAEQRARSFRIELETQGQYPAGLEFTTSGTLHVLRGAQPRTATNVEFRFVGGVSGRTATAHTEEGIWIHSDDPSFGEVYVKIEPEVVADLEWAGVVLGKADLPGMKDRRAGAPLGSSMVDDLRRQFVLAATDQRERAGEAGQWLAGDRRPGLADQDPELPLAGRVELFVRDRDHALLEVVRFQGDKVLERIVVRRLEVDVEIPAAAFVVDGRGQKVRPVRQYLPLWGEIQDVLKQAEARALEQAEARAKAAGTPVVVEETLRPSKRPK